MEAEEDVADGRLSAAINLPIALPAFTCSHHLSSSSAPLALVFSPALVAFLALASFLAALSLPSLSPYRGFWCSVLLLFRVMEGKNKKQSGSASSPPKTTSSSSLVADLFGGKSTPSPSSSSFFHSVFPPASTVLGRDSSRSDIFNSSWKQDAQGQSWNPQNVAADGTGHGGGNRERNSAYQNEKIDPCSFSSSLYYGGQDICTDTSNSPKPGYNYKKDGEDDTNNPNAVSRGNWWQGSLYY